MSIKLIKLVFLFPLLLLSNPIRQVDIVNYSLSVKSKCINGYLYDEITGKIHNVNILVQQPTCINYSAWDGSCTSGLLKCKGE